MFVFASIVIIFFIIPASIALLNLIRGVFSVKEAFEQHMMPDINEVETTVGMSFLHFVAMPHDLGETVRHHLILVAALVSAGVRVVYEDQQECANKGGQAHGSFHIPDMELTICSSIRSPQQEAHLLERNKRFVKPGDLSRSPEVAKLAFNMRYIWTDRDFDTLRHEAHHALQHILYLMSPPCRAAPSSNSRHALQLCLYYKELPQSWWVVKFSVVSGLELGWVDHVEVKRHIFAEENPYVMHNYTSEEYEAWFAAFAIPPLRMALQIVSSSNNTNFSYFRYFVPVNDYQMALHVLGILDKITQSPMVLMLRWLIGLPSPLDRYNRT